MTRTALYRFFDGEGQLLYVGITKKLAQRWTYHSKTKPWWPQVDRREVEWHETREDAESAEVEAIRNEDPLHNVTHSRRLRPGRPEGQSEIDIAASRQFTKLTKAMNEKIALVDRIGMERARLLARVHAETGLSYAKIGALVGLKRPTVQQLVERGRKET